MKLLTSLKPSLLLFLFYAILATSLLAPIATDTTFPSVIDYTNHIAAVIEAKLAFAEGQFPLRIAPMEMSGWRYPNFQFYSPTTYTLAGFIYKWFTPSNPITAVKFTLWLALVMGGMFMQRLAYWFVKSKPVALLSGIVYITAPYYVVVVTGFGNLSESLALGILPAVIYFTLQHYLHYKDHKTLIQTALAWYLLITIHMITFIYTAIFIGFLLIAMSCKSKRHWKNLFATGIAIAFGCLLAMWFIAPIALLNKYLIMAKTFVNPKEFQSYAPALSNLLFPGHLYFQGAMGGKHVAVGWPILVGACLSFYAFFNNARIASKRANYWLTPLLFIFFLAFILAWSPFCFLQWAPSILLVGQYCWRFLDQVIWIGALLFAWSVCWLFNNKLDLKQTILGVLLLVLTASASFPTLYPGLFNIDLKEFIKKPYAIFNRDSYTIEFNKQTGFVDKIDTMQLPDLMPSNILQLNSVYAIPQTLMSYAKTPKLTMNGVAPDDLPNHTLLKAQINNVTMATFNLSPGKFSWEIPLNPAILAKSKQAKVLNLQFKLNTHKKTAIAIDELSLTGFLQSTHTLNVKTVQPFCHQEKALTVCKIKVGKQINLLELPILYYPKLLKITLNGQPISYQGIVYQNNLIAGIEPIAGQVNSISIQFTGLLWANRVSWLCWILWTALLGYYLLTRNKSRKA